MTIFKSSVKLLVFSTILTTLAFNALASPGEDEKKVDQPKTSPAKKVDPEEAFEHATMPLHKIPKELLEHALLTHFNVPSIVNFSMACQLLEQTAGKNNHSFWQQVGRVKFNMFTTPQDDTEPSPDNPQKTLSPKERVIDAYKKRVYDEDLAAEIQQFHAERYNLAVWDALVRDENYTPETCRYAIEAYKKHAIKEKRDWTDGELDFVVYASRRLSTHNQHNSRDNNLVSMIKESSDIAVQMQSEGRTFHEIILDALDDESY